MHSSICGDLIRGGNGFTRCILTHHPCRAENPSCLIHRPQSPHEPNLPQLTPMPFSKLQKKREPPTCRDRTLGSREPSRALLPPDGVSFENIAGSDGCGFQTVTFPNGLAGFLYVWHAHKQSSCHRIASAHKIDFKTKTSPRRRLFFMRDKPLFRRINSAMEIPVDVHGVKINLPCNHGISALFIRV